MQTFAQQDPTQLSSEDTLHRRDCVLEQMRWARAYTEQLLDSIPSELWYAKPGSIPTNIAWQVGHLAVAQYGLMLFRQRGRMPGDLDLLPGWLRKQFGRGTTPPDAGQGKPSPEELMQRLAAIHEAALKEVAELTVQQLLETTEMPFTAYPNKLGALMFCPIHESIHTGQIGLLRRALGLEPLR
ncbi:MAG: DinB family protein [Planctomycetales bacterium]|nr:DinB family protein [Planctomycetales bacterium]